MGIFIDKEEEIKVEIYIEENDQIKVWTKNDIPKEKEKIAKKYEIFFRIPTYKDRLIFLDSGIKFDENGNVSFVSNQARFTRFVTLLKRWSFVDNSGNEIPATESNAELLAPSVSSVIIQQLEEALKTE